MGRKRMTGMQRGEKRERDVPRHLYIFSCNWKWLKKYYLEKKKDQKICVSLVNLAGRNN